MRMRPPSTNDEIQRHFREEEKDSSFQDWAEDTYFLIRKGRTLDEIEREKISAKFLAFVSRWVGKYGLHAADLGCDFKPIDSLSEQERTELIRKYHVAAFNGEKVDWEALFGKKLRYDEVDRFTVGIGTVGGSLLSACAELLGI